MPAGIDERSDEPLGVIEARADHRAAGRAGGDALADDGELEEREGLIPGGIGDVEAGRPRVALDHLGARGEALGRGHRGDDPRGGQHVVVARLAPEREQRPEVGQRVAERAHLPVQDGDDAAGTGGVQDGVVEPEVAVHDRVDALGRERADQLVTQRVQRGHVLDARRLRLLRPAPQLARHVARRSAELGQPDRRRVHGVQRGEHVDERFADRVPLRRRVGVAVGQRVAADVPEHALHHVERRAELVAQVQRARHRDGGPVERGEYAVLAAHVVRGGKDVSERWPAQDELAGVAGDAVGQVRLAAGDQRDVAVQPAGVVQHIGEQRSDDLGVGARGDALEPLGGRVVEAGLGHAGCRSRRLAASARPSSRSW